MRVDCAAHMQWRYSRFKGITIEDPSVPEHLDIQFR